MSTLGLEIGGGSNDAVDLETYRPRFEQLYMKEHRPLKEVIEILKKEGCDASRNQCLKKIRKWQLEKKNRHSDMLELLQKINQSGKALDESHVFQVRGRTISGSEVVRYFSRREHHQTWTEDVIAYRNSKTGIEKSRIEALRPALNLPAPLHSAQEFFHSIARTQTSLLHSPIQQRMALGKADEADIELINNIKKTLTTLTSNLNQGARYIHIRQSQLGGAVLERAFQTIESVVRQGHPELISKLLSSLHVMHYFKLSELAEMFTRYVYQISYQILGSSPMTDFADQLHRHWNLLDVLKEGPVVHHDITAKSIGKQHIITLSSRYSQLLTLRALESPLEELVPKYESFLRDIHRLPKQQLHVTARTEYGTYLATHGKFSQGMKILKELNQEISEPYTDLETYKYIVKSSLEYALLYMDQPEIEGFEEDEVASTTRADEVEGILKGVVERSYATFGPDNIITVEAMAKLQQFYTFCGIPEKARIQMELLMNTLKEFKLE